MYVCINYMYPCMWQCCWVLPNEDKWELIAPEYDKVGLKLCDFVQMMPPAIGFIRQETYEVAEIISIMFKF